MAAKKDLGEPIAFQGVLGANSHVACSQAYPDMEPLPCDSFEDAFTAVESGRAELGMIPIENSLGGRVADIHHLLRESSLYIIGEFFLPIQYLLLASHGGTLEGLKEVWSHPQALAQCRTQIRELGLKPVPRADTAGAAAEVADMKDYAIGAVSNELAAKIYGLDLLRTRFEDRIGNTTRFIVMSRRRVDPDPQAGPCMVSLIFIVRSVPAALYKAMGGFATNGVNITKLESYISGERFNVAQFYAEIEGHPADLNVARALEELDYFSSSLRIMGAFPAQPYRGS